MRDLVAMVIGHVGWDLGTGGQRYFVAGREWGTVSCVGGLMWYCPHGRRGGQLSCASEYSLALFSPLFRFFFKSKLSPVF